MAKRSRLTVIYKSGATIDLTCDAFEVKRRGGEIVEVTWENPRPRPLHFGVDDVAAVWEHIDEPSDGDS